MGGLNDAKINPESWAERLFRSVPSYAQELRCKCVPDEPYYLDAINHNSWVWIPGEGKWKYWTRVCSTCARPPRYGLVRLLEECEGCERYYVPLRLPDKFKLCPRCSATIPTRPRRPNPRNNSNQV